MASDRDRLARAARLFAAPPTGPKLAVGVAVTLGATVLALFVALALVGVVMGGQAKGQAVVCRPSTVGGETIPARLQPIYVHASASYDLGARGPSVLAAINQIETGFGRNRNTSSAGAQGFMQFLPSTWERWGVDGDGDGDRDIQDPDDAVHGAARYLQASGAPKDWYRAVFAYNHADWYVRRVLDTADRFRGSCTATVDDGPAQRVGDLDFADRSGPWGGSEKFARALARLGARNGCTVVSAKRQRVLTASGNPSDHWVGSRASYAVDLDGPTCSMTYPGGDADRTAQAIAAALDMPSHTGVVNVIHGAYRFQLLWQTDDHYDHVHIGVRRLR